MQIQTFRQRDDPLSPVSAPGTETKPSLWLSISLFSSAIQHPVNAEPQNTRPFSRKRQIDDKFKPQKKGQLHSPRLLYHFLLRCRSIMNPNCPISCLHRTVLCRLQLLSLRHNETAFLILTYLTIITKRLRII